MSNDTIDPPWFRYYSSVTDLLGGSRREIIPRISPVYRTAFPSPSMRNITAPVQWLASRRVTLIESLGVRSISVGVFRGIGLYVELNK